METMLDLGSSIDAGSQPVHLAAQPHLAVLPTQAMPPCRGQRWHRRRCCTSDQRRSVTASVDSDRRWALLGERRRAREDPVRPTNTRPRRPPPSPRAWELLGERRARAKISSPRRSRPSLRAWDMLGERRARVVTPQRSRPTLHDWAMLGARRANSQRAVAPVPSSLVGGGRLQTPRATCSYTRRALTLAERYQVIVRTASVRRSVASSRLAWALACAPRPWPLSRQPWSLSCVYTIALAYAVAPDIWASAWRRSRGGVTHMSPRS